jgi:hypothetical protein
MKRKVFVTAILIAILITACGAPSTQSQESTPDVAAIRTSAAGTVVSQFTLTAAAFTDTPASAPATEPPATEVATQAPAVTTTATTQPVAQVTNAQGTTVALCDSLTFVADVNVPDGTNMSPGQDFTKTWRVKNSGSCPWGAGYKLIYSYGDKMSGQAQPLTQVVQPGQEVEISVQFTTPNTANQYVSAWQMSNPKGTTFGPAIFVKIIVQ